MESGDHGIEGLRAGGFEIDEEVECLGGGGVEDAAVGVVNCMLLDGVLGVMMGDLLVGWCFYKWATGILEFKHVQNWVDVEGFKGPVFCQGGFVVANLYYSVRTGSSIEDVSVELT